MRLSEQLASVQKQQEVMRVRERLHRELSETTNKRVLQWNFFSLILLCAMGVWQVYYFTRFFDQKRVV
ncbi:emp24/gp25L/p24 family/GOLD [compost metagenome]